MKETICAISTATGLGAIAIVRASGPEAFEAASQLFRLSSRFKMLQPQVAKFATIYDGDQLIDQVVVTKFAAPKSYTGEDMVEISCHGSWYIQKKILELLLENGCRLATPGEFTQRAFLNGKLDLPQAEAVADLIASQTEAAHKLAVNQLKGDFSNRIHTLRERFVNLASLMELELDFSEEEVEFADRNEFHQLLNELDVEVERLTRSFKMGNALKNGIPVAIVGQPNVGKSTLLNAILQHDRAIVSNVPGTTRDTIEDTFTLEGTLFRFIDTAGIRSSVDEIENFGIERTYQAAEQAAVILYMVDASAADCSDVAQELIEFKRKVDVTNKHLLVVVNKIDACPNTEPLLQNMNEEVICISAKLQSNVEAVYAQLKRYVTDFHLQDATMLTNERHYELLMDIALVIKRIRQGLLDGVPTDLLAEDVRVALYDLGCLTGTISTDDLLNNIFGKFCIGK